MRSKMAVSLSIAATSLSFLIPALAQARVPAKVQPSQNATTADSGTAVPGQDEAQTMVPALVELAGSVDARRTQPGQAIQATLHGKVRLKNGTELPSGTVLTGVVAQDDMQLNGTAKLALTFTDAKLKNGTIVPIKATIMGIYPASSDAYGSEANSEPSAAAIWNSTTLRMDQIDAVSGVDLHSDIASADSGVLVSKKKDDVKLGGGIQMVLAIGAEKSGQQGATANGGTM